MLREIDFPRAKDNRFISSIGLDINFINRENIEFDHS